MLPVGQGFKGTEMKKRGKHFAGKNGIPARFRPEAVTQWRHTIDMQQGLDRDQRDELERTVLVAFEALRTGKANVDQFAKLEGAVELSGKLCASGIGKEYAGVVEQARVALERIKRRAATVGKFGIDGPAIEPLRTALALHTEHLRTCARREVMEAVHSLEKSTNQRKAA